MKHVLKILKPSFDPPGRLTSFTNIVQVLLSNSFAYLMIALYPGITTMRTSLLQGLLSEVQLQHAAWLADDNLARHLTMTLDGWSNARMESIYAFNIIFPDRRVILLKSEDLSTTTHSGQNIAGGGSSRFVCTCTCTLVHPQTMDRVLTLLCLCRPCHQDYGRVWATKVCWTCF